MSHSQETADKGNQTLVLAIGSESPEEFKMAIMGALFRTFSLVFAGREKDLTDDDAYSLYRLADLGASLCDDPMTA